MASLCKSTEILDFPIIGYFLIYLFGYPEVFKYGIPSFEGLQQYSRYSGTFRHVVKSFESHLKSLEDEANDVTSHSCNKGIATMIAVSRCTIVHCDWLSHGWH